MVLNFFYSNRFADWIPKRPNVTTTINMAASSDIIYQFKISLKRSKPPIWRRIQVPSTYSFFDMHAVIQNAMGWLGGHLHEFNMKHPVTGQKIHIGEPRAGFGPEVFSEDHAQIGQYFIAEKQKAIYLYDFGDGWYHDIVLEKILTSEVNVHYPRCIAGKRACPPEDCGGVDGYAELLYILANPEHQQYQDKKEWMEEMGLEDFDPEKFDVNSTSASLGAYMFL